MRLICLIGDSNVGKDYVFNLIEQVITDLNGGVKYYSFGDIVKDKLVTISDIKYEDIEKYKRTDTTITYANEEWSVRDLIIHIQNTMLPPIDGVNGPTRGVINNITKDSKEPLGVVSDLRTTEELVSLLSLRERGIIKDLIFIHITDSINGKVIKYGNIPDVLTNIGNREEIIYRLINENRILVKADVKHMLESVSKLIYIANNK